MSFDKNRDDEMDVLQMRYEQALEMIDEGELEDALDESRKLLAEDDQNPFFWCLEGKIRQMLGEEQAAERAFDRACQLEPGMAEPQLYKAAFMIELGRYEDAIGVLKQALQYTDDPIDERDAYFMWAEAEIHIAREALTQLMEEMSEMFEEGSEQPSLTMPPDVRQQLERGLELTQKAIDLNSELADLWHLRAGVLMDLEQTDEALRCYEEALRQEPDRPDFLHDMGLACEVAERYEDARKCYRKLYDLETSEEIEGMEFSRAEFSEMAHEVWHSLENALMEMLDEPLPPFEVVTEDFPSADLLDQAPADSPFNPWAPLRLEISQKGEEDPQIRCIFYQRNIEREVDTEEPHEMIEYLRFLLEDVLFNLSNLESLEPLEA
ncbi:MAG: tetratricopeptide repeat protein [Myxococcales bacterium]|nr:tetratricopeptide repeat protein [Myxococcales bacterium]